MTTTKTPQLTVSSLIQYLTTFQAKHGDLPLILIDADTGYPFLLKEKHFDIPDFIKTPCLAIEVDYGDELLPT